MEPNSSRHQIYCIQLFIKFYYDFQIEHMVHKNTMKFLKLCTLENEELFDQVKFTSINFQRCSAIRSDQIECNFFFSYIKCIHITSLFVSKFAKLQLVSKLLYIFKFAVFKYLYFNSYIFFKIKFQNCFYFNKCTKFIYCNKLGGRKGGFTCQAYAYDGFAIE